jgi:uncharacterized repeat protein (TIGR02543 family)
MKTKNLLGILSISILAALSLSGCETNRNNNNDSIDSSITNGGGDSDSGSGDSGNENPQVSTYTITFESNGGSSVGSISVDSNTTLTNLETPTKDGYIFDGWYTNASLSTMFDTTSKITANMTLYAKWTEIKSGDLIKSVAGYNEGLYATFTETDASSTALKVEVKKSDATSYTLVDSNLIRKVNDTSARVDIVGLSAGSYDVKITNSLGATQTKTGILVSSDDRSGYAHFGVSAGVGAYNNDGTLKDNAVVVYISDSNKNTVSATIGGKIYTGIVNIANAATEKNPVDIRIIGKVSTTQFNSIKYTSTAKTSALLAEQKASIGGLTTSKISAETIIDAGYNSYSDDLAEGITTIEGLKSQVIYSSGEYDTYWNMCDVTSTNLTVEGIGNDAEIFQWGFEFKKSNSIEVKNLTFSDYTEDAVGFEGAANVSLYGNYWLHNCTFNKGVNNWDFTYEQDKADGDGATDIKRVHNVTVSYTRYNNTHKTNLIGSGDDVYQANITLHHNFYNQCSSRLPLLREANVHIYNNYYYKCTTSQDVRANAFVYSEYNYFEGCKNPQKITTTDTYTSTVIKSYNDYLDSCGTSQATVVTSRTASVDGACTPYGTDKTDYTNFDTNSSLFYYDSTNQKSNVSYLQTNKATIKTDAKNFAGAGTMGGSTTATDSSTKEDTSTKYTVSFNTNGGSAVSNITVSENGTITLPTTTKSGYKFAGWYTNSSLSTAFTSSTKVTSNITLYAKWTEYTSTSYSLDLSAFTKGTLSTTTTGGNFTIYATSEKTVTVSDEKISLGGAGNITSGYRLIAFDVTEGQKITIKFNGGVKTGTTRTLVLADANATKLSESTATTGTTDKLTFEYTSTITGTIYLYSSNSGIDVYTIVVA